VQPTRRQPVRCQCTPNRRAFFGKGWGRWDLRMKLGVEGGYRLQQRLLWWKGKLIVLFVMCQGCGSNSEELIRQSNSDVSAQLWQRIGWRRVVWEKTYYWGTQVAHPSTHMYTHTHAPMCPRTESHAHTHTCTQARTNKTEKIPNQYNFSKPQKVAIWRKVSKLVKNQNFHKTLPPNLLQTIKGPVPRRGQIR